MSANPSTSAEINPTPERILKRLDWEVIRRLDGILQGDYSTLFYGHGLDLADLREYQMEDDIRYIDWNVTARMNTLHVRQYIDDRDINAWFLVDLSPSMRFGPLERPKETVLVDLVTTLSRLVTRNGNRAGAILYNNKIEKTIPPRGGQIQVLRLTRELLRKREVSGKSTTDLNTLLTAALNTIKRRSLVFVVSDFISQPGWEKPLSLLNQRNEMIAIRIWDPREIELPKAGLIIVEDFETGEQLYVDTSNPNFRRRFYEIAEKRETTLKDSFKRAAVDLYAISTEENLVQAIVRMAAMRKKRRMR